MKYYGVFIGGRERKEYKRHRTAEKAAAEWFAQTYGRNIYCPPNACKVANKLGYQSKVLAETE